MYTCANCGTLVDSGYVCHVCGYKDEGMKEHLAAEEAARLAELDSADATELEAEASGWYDGIRSSDEEPI